MIPREVVLEMVQFIALNLSGTQLDINKLPEIEGVSPVVMAQTLCETVPPEDARPCMSRAAAISAAYIRRSNKVYYNAFILHPESNVAGKSFILHELVHWGQDVDFPSLTCAQLKDKELEAYRIQDSYLASLNISSNFAGKFSERFVCRDKN